MRKRPKSLVLAGLAILSCGSWFLFTSKFALDEALLGIGCALLTTYITASAWRRMKIRFSPTLPQLLTGWSAVWHYFSGSWQMLVILAKTLTAIQAPGSYYRAANFRLARGERGVAQKILATAYVSATPDSIVIGADGETLLFHQMERSGVPRILGDLEASR